MERSITILRLGHRPQRDMRVTTHVALVGRAFGADEMVITLEDPKLIRTVSRVCEMFGGKFEIRFQNNWRKFVQDWKNKGKVIHLTMYGEHIDSVIGEIKKLSDQILIIVGAEKVPRDIYDLADYNIAVGNQPHSEIAALAVFLDRLNDGSGLRRKLAGQLVIEPNPRGKSVHSRKDK